jgi:hypothetical protein
VSLVIGLAAAAVYYVYGRAQSACDIPLGNSYVPWSLLVVELGAVAILGKLLDRPRATILAGLAAATAVAVVAAIVAFILLFAAGNCGE